MATRWAQRRIRRRLKGIAGPQERLVHYERLRTGGFWVTTDQALYQLSNFAEPERVAFDEITSVGSLSPGSPALVVTAPGHQPLIGDLSADSPLAQQLRQLS